MSTSEKELVFEQLQKLFLKSTASSEHLEALLVEYLRFIHLKKSRPSNSYQPCAQVDSMWHAHILCTKQYHEFCNRCNGGNYIHHLPDKNSNVQTYRNTLKAYTKEFGSDPNPRFWTPIDGGGTGSNGLEAHTLLANVVGDAGMKAGEYVIKIPDFHLTLEELDGAKATADSSCTTTERVAICQINAMQKLKVIFHISEIKYKDAENGMFSYIGEQATSSPGCSSNAIFFCRKCHHVWEFGFCNRDSSCLDCENRNTTKSHSSGAVETGPVDYIVRCFGCG